MALTCKSCGSEDVRPSHRNPVERILGYMIPFRTFRCNSCEHRFWGLMPWPYERNQMIGYAATLVVLLLMFTLPFMMGGSKAEPEPEAVQAEVVDNPEAGETQTGATPTEPIGDQTQPATENTAADQTQPAEQPSGTNQAGAGESQESTDQPAAAGESGKTTVSPFVAKQLERNGGDLSNTTVAEPNAQPETEKVAVKTEPEQKVEPKRRTTQSKPKPKPQQRQRAQAPTRAGGILESLSYTLEDGSLVVELRTDKEGGQAFYKDWASNRHIIDLTGSWKAGAQLARQIKVTGYPVKTIRTGFHQDYFRIVLDLNQTNVPKPQLERRGRLLRIKLAPPT